MTIYGKEYGLAYTIGAEQEIARLCPDGDLRKIREFAQGGTDELIDRMVSTICIMSKWHEVSKQFETPDYQPQPLQPEVVKSLPRSVYRKLQAEAIAVMVADSRPTVEAEAEKKDVAL